MYIFSYGEGFLGISYSLYSHILWLTKNGEQMIFYMKTWEVLGDIASNFTDYDILLIIDLNRLIVSDEVRWSCV